MKELPVRKHPRLKNYDYSQNGAYFITFCVKDKKEMLGKIVGRDAPGTPDVGRDAPGTPDVGRDAPGTPDVGRDALGAPCMIGVPYTKTEIPGTPNVGRDAPGAPYIQLNEYGEIVFAEIEKTPSYYNGITIDKFVVMPNHIHLIIMIDRPGAPGASRPTNAVIPSIISILKKKTNKAFGFELWQASYYDHIIRNETEYRAIWRYIDQNPAKWAEDKFADKNIQE